MVKKVLVFIFLPIYYTIYEIAQIILLPVLWNYFQFSPFYKIEYLGSESLRNFLKFTKLVKRQC